MVRFLVRPLGVRETDHELLWSLVGLGALGLAIAWTIAGSSVMPVCPLRVVTGLPCPTCGSTRAWAALLDGRVGDAWRLNPLAVAAAVVVPSYALYGLTVVGASLPRVRMQLDGTGRLVIRALIAMLGAALWLFLIVDGR